LLTESCKHNVYDCDIVMCMPKFKFFQEEETQKKKSTNQHTKTEKRSTMILDILLCTGGVCVSVESPKELSVRNHSRKKKRTNQRSFVRTKTMKISAIKFSKLERAIAREGGYVLVNPRVRTIQSEAILERAWMEKQERRHKKSKSSPSKFAIALRRMRGNSRKFLV
jgi:hypothetical protein